MIKAKWSQIAAACSAVEAMAGGDVRCWVEHAGDVVAGERPDRLVTPVTARVGGTDDSEVVAVISGRNGHAWIELLSAWIRTDLAQQGTIADMAAATARTWRQMNALLAMASSSKVGLEPGKTIQRVFDLLVRSTRFDGGIAVVRLPGGEDCIQLDANGVQRVPLDMVAGLEDVESTVHTFAERGDDDAIFASCAALLEPYTPAAVARLQTDNDRFGWLVAAAAETLPSDDLKLFGAAARIIATALENSHTMSLERAATRLEVEREMYSALAKSAPVGLFRADADGRVLYVSDRWCRVTGATEAEARRDGWLCAVHPDDLARVTAEWEEMLVEGIPVRCEHRCRREDDAWVLTEIAREGTEDGGFVGTMTDVTDRKLAERDKAELEAHLRHAQKMEAVGTMAGGIAHDFNNILGAIVGNAELAMDRIPVDDRARVHLDRLLQGAFRARDLVRQLLAFSRQTEIVRRPQELGPVVEEALGLIRASVPSTVEIATTLRARGGAVKADATQLHQIVVNLCTNAYQAIGDEPGRLEIRLERVVLEGDVARAAGAPARAGAYVRLSVVDTGPGISEEARDRIFDPFFTTKGARGGSGMGLAVVHGIVSDHGGFLDVANEPGRGARFDVYLPEIDAAAAPASENDAAAAESVLGEVDAPVPISAADVRAVSAGAAASTQDADAAGEHAGALVPVSSAARAAVRSRALAASAPHRRQPTALRSADQLGVDAPAPRDEYGGDDDAIETSALPHDSRPRPALEAPASVPADEPNAVDGESLESLVAEFLAGEDGDAAAHAAPQTADLDGGHDGAGARDLVPAGSVLARRLGRGAGTDEDSDTQRAAGAGAALRSRLGLPPAAPTPMPGAAKSHPTSSSSSTATPPPPAAGGASREESSASAHSAPPVRTTAKTSAAERHASVAAPKPKPASAPHDESAFGEEDLLERLVAEFLAKEGADVDGELSPEALEAIDDGVDPELCDAEGEAPSRAPISAHGSPRRREAAASANTLPAVRGAGLPARGRLLERAPELRRGHARLLGAGAAKPRAALIAPAASGAADTPNRRAALIAPTTDGAAGTRPPTPAVAAESPPATTSDDERGGEPQDHDSTALSERVTPADADPAATAGAAAEPRAETRLAVPFMFGLPLG